MSNLLCEHQILRDLDREMAVTQCIRHSRPQAGVAVWVWSAQVLPRQLCPCGFTDRFCVVTEPAGIRWMLCADVVFGPPQPTKCDALRAAARICGLPGCTLFAVPAGQHCTVLCTRTEHVEVPATQACGLCVYPWLVAGRSLKELAVLAT